MKPRIIPEEAAFAIGAIIFSLVAAVLITAIVAGLAGCAEIRDRGRYTAGDFYAAQERHAK